MITNSAKSKRWTKKTPGLGWIRGGAVKPTEGWVGLGWGWRGCGCELCYVCMWIWVEFGMDLGREEQDVLWVNECVYYVDVIHVRVLCGCSIHPTHPSLNIQHQSAKLVRLLIPHRYPKNPKHQKKISPSKREKKNYGPLGYMLHCLIGSI